MCLGPKQALGPNGPGAQMGLEPKCIAPNGPNQICQTKERKGHLFLGESGECESVTLLIRGSVGINTVDEHGGPLAVG